MNVIRSIDPNCLQNRSVCLQQQCLRVCVCVILWMCLRVCARLLCIGDLSASAGSVGDKFHANLMRFIEFRMTPSTNRITLLNCSLNTQQIYVLWENNAMSGITLQFYGHLFAILPPFLLHVPFRDDFLLITCTRRNVTFNTSHLDGFCIRLDFGKRPLNHFAISESLNELNAHTLHSECNFLGIFRVT